MNEIKINRHSLKTIKFHYERLGRSDTVNLMVKAYGFTIDEAVKYLKSL
jgi:hypothetical protein